MNVTGRAIEHAGLPPELWRPASPEDATDALAARAWLASVAPQHVIRTHEPVFVRHVDFYSAPVAENSGATGQGDVMVVDHVVRAVFDDLAHSARVQDRTA